MTSALIVFGLTGCGAASDGTRVESASSTVTSAGENIDPDDAEMVGDDDALAALAAARQRWADADIGDHSLVVQDECGECGPDQRAAGEVVRWGDETYSSGPALTVESVFDRIEAAIADGRDVEASYDDETGYPSEVLIDAAQAAVDGGSRLLIHEVRPGLPGSEFSPDSFDAAALHWQATRPHAYEYVVTVACGGCPFEGRLWTRVVGDQVVDERFVPAGGDETISALTIDELFSDLGDLFGSDGGLVEDGVLINGTAKYDAEYGYPNWIGLDLEILERREWNRNLPPRLVYMITGFEPLAMDEYCAAVDDLFSITTDAEGATAYQRQLQRLRDMAPTEHQELWDLLLTLVGEPFDYDNFNPAADALDAAAASLTDDCPALGFFVMTDEGYVTYDR